MSSVRKWAGATVLLAVAGVLVLATVGSADDTKAKEKKKEVWTDSADPTIPADFKYQGEYVGTVKNSDKLAAQVIALGDGQFQAVMLPGGLPGAGWDGKHKALMAGKLEDGKAVFTPATGKRRYLARKPESFSATDKFPPEGQKDYTGTISDDVLTGKTDDGSEFTLKKIVRKSRTLGAKPPDGAVVLFDGKDTSQWDHDRLDKATGVLNTEGGDIHSKKKFNNYSAHVEFLLPFRPAARGQERGNSGFYQVDRYEVQILDSFGLDGKNNECGGVYSQVAPKVNMCLPPLEWQTYDVDFTNAVLDASGKKEKNARITLKQNGVLILDNVEIKSNTENPNNKDEGTPGSIRLQGHGNPLQFRNIWVVEKS